MHKTTLPILTLLTALLHAGGAAQAQAPSFDVAPDCDASQVDKLSRAVDGALQRLSEVNNLSVDPFNGAFANAFGNYDSGTEEEQWSRILFALYHLNLQPLLTNTPGFTISSGPPPMFARVAFRCARSGRGDIAAEKSNGGIVLYPVFFDDEVVPHLGRWNDVRGSRVGTILHESVHLLGGPKDIEEGGRTQAVQAEQLAFDRDPRALSNAANYEMFYMSFPFQR